MNVVPLAIRTDQIINSVVYANVLTVPMKFLLNVSPSKEIGDHTRQRTKDKVKDFFLILCGLPWVHLAP